MDKTPTKDHHTINQHLTRVIQTAAGVGEDSIASAFIMNAESMSVTGLILGIHLPTLDPRIKPEVDALIRKFEEIHDIRLTSL